MTKFYIHLEGILSSVFSEAFAWFVYGTRTCYESVRGPPGWHGVLAAPGLSPVPGRLLGPPPTGDSVPLFRDTRTMKCHTLYKQKVLYSYVELLLVINLPKSLIFMSKLSNVTKLRWGLL